MQSSGEEIKQSLRGKNTQQLIDFIKNNDLELKHIATLIATFTKLHRYELACLVYNFVLFKFNDLMNPIIIAAMLRAAVKAHKNEHADRIYNESAEKWPGDVNILNARLYQLGELKDFNRALALFCESRTKNIHSYSTIIWLLFKAMGDNPIYCSWMVPICEEAYSYVKSNWVTERVNDQTLNSKDVIKLKNHILRAFLFIRDFKRAGTVFDDLKKSNEANFFTYENMLTYYDKSYKAMEEKI